MVCAAKGYGLTVVMPDKVTAERATLLRLLGARIVWSPGDQGSNGAVALAQELAHDNDAWDMPFQYGTPLIHDALRRDGRRDPAQCGPVAAFVAGLGTGGTLMGVGRRLREADPARQIVAAEPLQGDLLQGLRSLDDGFVPPILDLGVLDRKIFVSTRDAILWTRRLLHQHGLFVGVSSGAIASVAARTARELDGGNVVFLVPDGGWKYLGAGVYSNEPVDEVDESNARMSFW